VGSVKTVEGIARRDARGTKAVEGIDRRDARGTVEAIGQPRRENRPMVRATGLDGAWEALGGLWDRVATVSSARTERIVHDFAEIVGRAREPVEARRALVRLAGKLTGAQRVELYLGDFRQQRNVRRAACWPEPSLVRSRDSQRDNETVSLVTTPEGARVPRGEVREPVEPSLRLPLTWHGESVGNLVVYGGADRDRTSRSLLGRLQTMCLLAAATERSWQSSALEFAPPRRDPLTGVHHATFLDAFLVHALALARRHRDGLSLLHLGPDQLEQIRHDQGDAIADAVLQRVARAVIESLRVSDVVARLDRNRLAIVLPAAVPANAVRVARNLVRVVAEAGLTAPTTPPVTASVGIAGFPDHAEHVEGLQSAAAEALAEAQQLGRGQIVIRPPRLF
jgi:diguanylate cyclase (GGDEF)-like protein